MKRALPLFSISAMALGAVLTGGTAHADGTRLRCTTLSPSIAPGEAVTASELECVKVQEQAALDERTHVVLLPTGNTLKAGTVAIRNHGVVLYNQLAVGITDNIELSVSAPLAPLAASAGLRVQLMPQSSSLRVVLSGSAWTSLDEDDFEEGMLLTGAVTLAAQGERANLHATLGAAKPVERDSYYDDNEEPLLLASVGGIVQVGHKSALFAEVGRIGIAGDDDVMTGFMAGLKLMGKRLDADLGLLIPMSEEIDVKAIPLLSTSFHF